MKKGKAAKRSVRLLALAWAASIILGCATTAQDSLEVRLAAMPDKRLISYYHGINDRLKDIQAETRETDRQGPILEEDYLARMPYVVGGEAWELEQKREKASREMIRRGLMP